jgi:hypothetical protein
LLVAAVFAARMDLLDPIGVNDREERRIGEKVQHDQLAPFNQHEPPSLAGVLYWQGAFAV